MKMKEGNWKQNKKNIFEKYWMQNWGNISFKNVCEGVQTDN